MDLSHVAVRLPRDLDRVSVARLAEALDQAVAAPAPIIALTGHDETVFCLGLAIGATDPGPPATHAFAELLARLHACPKPVLAVVDGEAIGGGLGLACAADWVVATGRARFGLPELLWGLVPAIIWPVITDRMAPHTARQWTVSAHTRSAADGVDVGLVDELVPVERLDQAVARAVRVLRRVDRNALRQLRAWARRSRQYDLGEAVERGADLTAGMLADPAVRSRWQRFEQGAAPWSG